METKILIPVDGSTTAGRTLEKIVSLKERFPKELTLLHVVDIDKLAYRMIPDFQIDMVRENAGKAGQLVLDERAAILQEAGFNVKAFENIDQLIWGKYICNVSFSGPCTVFDYTLGELMADPAAWAIAQGCAREVQALGQAKNIEFTFDDPIEYIATFGNKMPDARPSMLLDHYAQRPSEIDAINGMVVELGKQLGIPTPYNEVLTAVIRQRESAF